MMGQGAEERVRAFGDFRDRMTDFMAYSLSWGREFYKKIHEMQMQMFHSVWKSGMNEGLLP